MSRKKKVRVHPISVKLEAVRRVEAGEAVSVVASSFDVRRTQVYLWLKQWRQEGGFGKRARGRPKRLASLGPPGSAAREVELERLVGQQQVELDFFRQALRQVGKVRQPITGPGAPPSGGSSPPRRPGRKAR